jgi:hypothetical protein
VDVVGRGFVMLAVVLSSVVRMEGRAAAQTANDGDPVVPAATDAVGRAATDAVGRADAPVAAADDPTDDPTMSVGATAEVTRVLMLVASDREAESRTAVEAVAAMLADLPVVLDVEWVASLDPRFREQLAATRESAVRRGARIAFWVDPATAGEVLIFVAEPGGGRVLVRMIDTEGEPDESLADIVATILRGTVEALVQGGEIGVRAPPPPPPPVVVVAPPPPPPPPPPVAAPPPPVAPPGPAVLELAGAYLPYLHDGGGSVVHGVRLALGWRPIDRLQVRLAYRFVVPFERENDLAALALSPHPFELGLLAHWSWGPWRLGVGGSLAVDVLTWSLSPRRDTVRAVGATSRGLAAVSPEVEFGWWPSGSYGLVVALGADVVFNDSASVIATASGPSVLVDPWPVRPFLRIGVDLPLF